MIVRRCCLIAALAAAAAPARAQDGVRCEGVAAVATTQWSGPLARTVSVHAGDVSLAGALAQLARAARIRISYSAESLPLDRRVCLSVARASVGAVLADVLRDTHVEPVIAGADHVVLAVARASQPEPARVVALERLLVQGRVEGELNGSAAASTVITGDELVERNIGTLGEALNGAVAGMWVWTRAGGSPSSEYGSLRGASSFRGAAPLVYLDGIALSSDHLLDRMPADAIERVEVIRGPQGAALYGSSAMAGVIRITTRQRIDDGARSTRVHSGVGIAASDYASGAQVLQQHALGFAAGTAARSATLNLLLGTLGDYVPDGGTQHLAADATGRLVGERAFVTGTVRFLADHAGVAPSPLLPDIVARSPAAAWLLDGATGSRRVRQVTAGVTSSVRTGGLWTHTLVAGLDGYGARGPSHGAADPTKSLEQDLTDALRLYVRASSTRPFEAGNGLAGSLTLAIDRSQLAESGFSTYDVLARVVRSSADSGAHRPAGTSPALVIERARTEFEQRSGNTGISAFTTLAWHGRYSVSGGVRLDRNSGLFDAGRWAALPMLGGSASWAAGPVALRLRSAWGRGIRWSSPVAAATWAGDSRLRALTQLAEEQSGIEAGADVTLANTLTLRVTRFDQTAIALTPAVDAAAPCASCPGQDRHRRTGIGQIDNDGWELDAAVEHGRFAATGTLAFVDSRVRALAQTYTGELRAGDRMPGVPARTGSITASWRAPGWSASATAVHATDWINYDRLALLTAVAAAATPITGPDLRTFWREYRGVTHLRATLSRHLGSGMTLTLTGANLLDVQLGEPDNLTVRPGRTLSLGVRASF